MGGRGRESLPDAPPPFLSRPSTSSLVRASAFVCLACRETADNWDAEIAEDVGGECGKYGPVEHVHVDRDSRGFVYVVSVCRAMKRQL